MKYFLPLILFISFSAYGQDFVEVSYGAGYSEMMFYSFENDVKTTVQNTDWDLAFSAIGLQDAAIHFNEAASSTGSPLELYLSPTNSFEEEPDPGTLITRLYNDEVSWTSGAFNSLRDENNPFDYGWGIYNPRTNKVQGFNIYVLKLRDGSYKKFEIQSLDITTYNFRYADLNGDNEVSFAINKQDYLDRDLVHYSITSGKVVEEIPAEWDLLFTRYISPLDDGNGGILEYPVSGVLQPNGSMAARADGIDPATVEFEDYKNQLSSFTDTIGHDWKSFNLGTFEWVIDDDLAFFVETSKDEVWKVAFVDFEGASTGVTVFQKWFVGTTGVDNDIEFIERTNLFPSPAVGELNVRLTSQVKKNLELVITDATGRIMTNKEVIVFEGDNEYVFNVSDFPRGNYILNLIADKKVIARKFEVIK